MNTRKETESKRTAETAAVTQKAQEANPEAAAPKAAREEPFFTERPPFIVREEKEGSSIIINNVTKFGEDDEAQTLIESAAKRFLQLTNEDDPHESFLTLKKQTHENRHAVFYIKESCTGETLLDILRTLDQKKILEIALMLINGLIRYEKQGIVTELHPNCILMCRERQLKILDHSILKIYYGNDLGLTGTLVVGQIDTSGILQTSPECFKRGYKATPQSAIYNFGIILLQMFRKDQAFPSIPIEQLRQESSREEILRQLIPVNTGHNDWKKIISWCLMADPKARPTTADIKLLLLNIQAEVNPIKSDQPENLAKADAPDEVKSPQTLTPSSDTLFQPAGNADAIEIQPIQAEEVNPIKTKCNQPEKPETKTDAPEVQVTQLALALVEASVEKTPDQTWSSGSLKEVKDPSNTAPSSSQHSILSPLLAPKVLKTHPMNAHRMMGFFRVRSQSVCTDPRELIEKQFEYKTFNQEDQIPPIKGRSIKLKLKRFLGIRSRSIHPSNEED